MADKRKRQGAIESAQTSDQRSQDVYERRRRVRRRRKAREEEKKAIRLQREQVVQAQHHLDELLAKKAARSGMRQDEEDVDDYDDFEEKKGERKNSETDKGKKKKKKEEEEEEELEDGYTLDNDPSGAQCSRPRKSNERNHEKWQRYKEIFSLYYAENGDLKIPNSHEHQGVKIGRILSQIRLQGHFVKDNPQRKQWLLERGVVLTYDSGLYLLDTTSVEKWQRYKEIFSLYYAENGDLNMLQSYQYQGVNIGSVLHQIRHRGCFVRDNAPRKQWLLEKGVSFTYDSLNSVAEEKWQRYKEIFSLYYAENGDLNIPQRYEMQGVKIGKILSMIRHKGSYVRDNAPRKLWLLEKGVSFTYD